jgi:2-keto-4-pentenoate hydratase
LPTRESSSQHQHKIGPRTHAVIGVSPLKEIGRSAGEIELFARHENPSSARAAAERLAAAWIEDLVLPDLPIDERPTTVEAGYEIQNLLAQAFGEGVAGYKLGLSSPNAMRASGLGRPIVGFMPPSRIHGSKAVVPIKPTEQFLIEVEIAFEIATDIHPGQPIDRVENVLDSAWLAIEIVRSHFVDRRKVALPSFIADGAGFHHLILGSKLTLEDASHLAALDLSLCYNGGLVSSKAPDGDRAEPLDALTMFLTMASERNQPLAAGMIVSTGNLVRPYEIGTPGRCEAALGNARVEFSLQLG